MANMIYGLIGGVVVLVLVWLGYFAYMAVRTQVPSALVNKRALQRLKNYVTAQHILEDATVYELGSAFGSVCFMIERLGANRVVGYELSPLHVYGARLKKWLFNSEVIFEQKDFFDVDLSDADVVYMWLVPKIADRTWTKIKQECRPGTIVIVYGSPISNETPIDEVRDAGNSVLFWVYRV